MVKRIAAISAMIVLVSLAVLFGGQLIKSKSFAGQDDFVVSPEKGEALVSTAVNIANDSGFYEKIIESSILRDASVCKDGDWIYFANPEDGNRLYKANEDWSEKVPVCEDVVKNIQVLDGWIYYVNLSDNLSLYRIKTDGTQRKKLNSDRSGWPTIIGEWIYYENPMDEGRLYKVKKDGTERTRVTDCGAFWLAADGEYIYFNGPVANEQTANIKRINTRTNAIEKISGDAGLFLTLDDEWIYYSNYSDNYNLYKMKKDGTQKTKLFDAQCLEIFLMGDWIYFTGNESQNGTRIYRMLKDGTNAVCISSDPARFLCKSDGYIYYNFMGSLYRIGNDDKEPVLVAGKRKEAATVAALGIFPDYNGLKSEAHNSNAAGEYQLLDKLTQGAFIADFDIDEKGNIYILDANALYGKAMQKSETVSSIKVYDSDQNFKYEIVLKEMDSCSAIAVHNDRIHVYNANDEKVYVYSIEGKLSGSFEALAGKQTAVRMDTDSEGRLYILSMYNPGFLRIFNDRFELVDEIGDFDFEMKVKDAEILQEKNPGNQDSSRRIQDFTIIGDGYILIKTEPQRLCLYNINTREVVKVMNLSDYADMVAYSNGVLYYTSSHDDSGKESYTGPEPDRIGRLRITKDTVWSTDYNVMSAQEIHMEKLDIPHFSQNSTHMRMIQTKNHIYFLDRHSSIFASLLKPEKVELKQSIYRISK